MIKKKIEYKRQLAPQGSLGNKTRREKEKANCELFLIFLWCFSGVSFSLRATRKERIKRFKTAKNQTYFTKNRTVFQMNLQLLLVSLHEIMRCQLKSHFFILHDHTDNCQLMNYLYKRLQIFIATLKRKSFNSDNTDGLHKPLLVISLFGQKRK